MSPSSDRWSAITRPAGRSRRPSGLSRWRWAVAAVAGSPVSSWGRSVPRWFRPQGFRLAWQARGRPPIDRRRITVEPLVVEPRASPG